MAGITSQAARHVLAELASAYFPDAVEGDASVTPIQRSFVELTARLGALSDTIADADRIEAALIARFGPSRVAVPAQGDTPATFIADVREIQQRFGTGPAARCLIASLRRRQRRFMKAAAAAGLPEARNRAHILAALIDATSAALLLAPVAGPGDLTCKLIVLIAISEAGPVEGSAIPGAYLRAIQADLDRFTDHDPGRS